MIRSDLGMCPGRGPGLCLTSSTQVGGGSEGPNIHHFAALPSLCSSGSGVNSPDRSAILVKDRLWKRASVKRLSACGQDSQRYIHLALQQDNL